MSDAPLKFFPKTNPSLLIRPLVHPLTPTRALRYPQTTPLQTKITIKNHPLQFFSPLSILPCRNRGTIIHQECGYEAFGGSAPASGAVFGASPNTSSPSLRRSMFDVRCFRFRSPHSASPLSSFLCPSVLSCFNFVSSVLFRGRSIPDENPKLSSKYFAHFCTISYTSYSPLVCFVYFLVLKNKFH